METKRSQLPSILLLSFGLLLALALAIIAFWPDLESSVFDSSLTAEKKFSSLRCPLMITDADGPAEISVKFTNPGDRPVQFQVRARISEGLLTLIRQEKSLVELAGNESRRIAWQATAEDAAFRRVVLARVYAFRSFGMPSRTGSCGIFVFNIGGIGGRLLYSLGVAVSLLSIGGGFALWRRGRRPLSPQDRQVGLAIGAVTTLVLANLAVAMMGWWLISILLSAGLVILLVVLLERLFLSRR